MGTVLLWILGILLGIVLLALVIVLVLLNIRAGIEAVGVTGEVSVEARYGPVRIPLYPRPRHLKKKKEETEAEQKKSEENEKKTSGKLGLSLPKDGLDVGEIAGTVRDFLSDLTDRLRISRLRARVVIGTDDAAQTGILLGQAAALCGIIVGEYFRYAGLPCQRGRGLQRRPYRVGVYRKLLDTADIAHQSAAAAWQANVSAVQEIFQMIS